MELECIESSTQDCDWRILRLIICFELWIAAKHQYPQPSNVSYHSRMAAK